MGLIFKFFIFVQSMAFSIQLQNMDLDVIGQILENEDVSAMSCITKSLCLIASDETNSLQFAEIKNNKIIAHNSFVDLGSFYGENDIEALTHDGKHFYALGSHGLTRKKSQYKESRFKLFRILINSGDSTYEVSTASLEPFISADPILKDYYKKPLNDNGINLEGMGYYNGRLYFGFRNPVIDGFAQVSSLHIDDVFSNSNSQMEHHPIFLGKNRGIRSLEFRNNQLFVLSGSGAVSGLQEAEFHHYDIDFNELKVSPIPHNTYKAEGFEFVNDDQVIFLYDSQVNGLPTLQDI